MQALGGAQIGSSMRASEHNLWLPDTKILRGLVGVFFARVQPHFPILRPTDFYASVETYKKNPSAPDDWHLTIAAVVALASSASEVRDSQLERTAVAVAQSIIGRIVCSTSMAAAKGLALFAYYLHLNSQRNAAWNLLGLGK